MTTPLQVDTNFPGGNAVIESVRGDVVVLRPDLRDTLGEWFYWHVRLRSAEGRRVRFEFNRLYVLTCRGPAVSWDGGASWQWLGSGGCAEAFECDIPESAADLRLSVGIPYVGEHLQRWSERHRDHPALVRESLCTSEAGRVVEAFRVLAPASSPAHCLVVTARHHACEAIANYTLEGLLDAALGRDELGRWFASNVEVLAIPFMDADGVEAGDQGKNRAGHDHNRDYGPGSRYRSVSALKERVPVWTAGRPLLAFDLHCPWISNDENERIFQVGGPDPAGAAAQARLGKCVEAMREGPLPYVAADDWPHGRGWNVTDPALPPRTCSGWARTVRGCVVSTSWEIPYANARCVEVLPAGARAFGRDLAAGVRRFLGG